MIQNSLPIIYQKWFSPKLLQFPIQETKADCNNCSMQKGKAPGDITYKAHLKCCTFHPFQPNYLIGAILSQQTDSAAAEVIRNKIKHRQYCLPIGIVAPLAHQVEFNQRKKSEFGNREDWLCPYYLREKNHCGIWPWRGAVCTSFYCQSSYGRKGMTFWQQMGDYLTYVEAALMEEAMVQLDFSPRQISDNLSYLNRFEATDKEKASESLPLALAIELWNGYFDEQEEFYKKCFQIVTNLHKRQFTEAMGEQGEMLEKSLLQALRDLEVGRKK